MVVAFLVIVVPQPIKFSIYLFFPYGEFFSVGIFVYRDFDFERF